MSIKEVPARYVPLFLLCVVVGFMAAFSDVTPPPDGLIPVNRRAIDRMIERQM